jgi:HEAT repeat protein
MKYGATRILALTGIGAVSVMAVAQCGSVDRDSPAAVRQEVKHIFTKTLDRMQYTLPSGVKATTWMPPDDSVHDRIKCLGTAAVPAIADLLRGNNRSFGSLLAIQMLGWAGGPEIVPPLSLVLSRSGDSLTLKIAALESLAAAPPDKALPVIQKVLHSEKNPYLLEEAASVAARLKDSVKD